MRRRSYESDADVALPQAFNAASIATTGGCGYVHPGDIPHRLFNGNKYFEPAEVMTVWEDRSGVAAWALVGPRHRSYDGHHMAAAGMEFAIVTNFASNAPSEALYRSAGFEPWHVLDGYVKPFGRRVAALDT